MNSIKRALLSIWKHKVKTIMLAIAFALIATMILSGIVINSAAQQMQNTAMKNIGTQVEMTSKSVNYTLPGLVAPYNSFAKTYPLTSSLLNQLESLTHVDSYNQISSYVGLADNFKIISSKQSKLAYELDPNTDNNISFLSVTNSAELNEFATNTYMLVAGRALIKADTGKNVAIINQNLAKKNNIKVADTITVKSQITSNNTVYSFKVVGIFNAPKVTDFETGYYATDPSDLIYTSDNSNYLMSYDTNPNSNNQNVLSPTFVKQIAEIKKIDPDFFKPNPDNAKHVDRAYFYIDDPLNISSFELAAKKIPGMQNFNLTTNSDLYTRVTAPIKATGMLSTVMIVILLVAGCIILSLIVVLSTKGRRREFGILLALGEIKLKIVLQVFIETLIPICIAFIIAIVASGFISQIVCNKLVDSNVQNTQVPTSVISQILNGKHSNLNFNTNNATVIGKLSVSVTLDDIEKIVSFGFLIVLISMLFPLLSILRLSPMRILIKKE